MEIVGVIRRVSAMVLCIVYAFTFCCGCAQGAFIMRMNGNDSESMESKHDTSSDDEEEDEEENLNDRVSTVEKDNKEHEKVIKNFVIVLKSTVTDQSNRNKKFDSDIEKINIGYVQNQEDIKDIKDKQANMTAIQTEMQENIKTTQEHFENINTECLKNQEDTQKNMTAMQEDIKTIKEHLIGFERCVGVNKGSRKGSREKKRLERLTEEQPEQEEKESEFCRTMLSEIKDIDKISRLGL